jgi:hypothetical protein
LFAQRWIPEEHIIFCVGVRVRYDEYRKVYGLTATRQSLFTINPGNNIKYIAMSSRISIRYK